MSANLVCWRCGEALRKDLPRVFPRLEKCRGCGADLHVCRLCRHHAPRYISQCDHELAEPPRDRELANFCQYFKPRTAAFEARQAKAAKDARSALDSLFAGGESGEAGPKTDGGAADEHSAALRALFGGDPDPDPER